MATSVTLPPSRSSWHPEHCTGVVEGAVRTTDAQCMKTSMEEQQSLKLCGDHIQALM
jgi:hypothetical protein